MRFHDVRNGLKWPCCRVQTIQNSSMTSFSLFSCSQVSSLTPFRAQAVSLTHMLGGSTNLHDALAPSANTPTALGQNLCKDTSGCLLLTICCRVCGRASTEHNAGEPDVSLVNRNPCCRRALVCDPRENRHLRLPRGTLRSSPTTQPPPPDSRLPRNLKKSRHVSHVTTLAGRASRATPHARLRPILCLVRSQIELASGAQTLFGPRLPLVRERASFCAGPLS